MYLCWGSLWHRIKLVGFRIFWKCFLFEIWHFYEMVVALWRSGSCCSEISLFHVLASRSIWLIRCFNKGIQSWGWHWGGFLQRYFTILDYWHFIKSVPWWGIEWLICQVWPLGVLRLDFSLYDYDVALNLCLLWLQELAAHLWHSRTHLLILTQRDPIDNDVCILCLTHEPLTPFLWELSCFG